MKFKIVEKCGAKDYEFNSCIIFEENATFGNFIDYLIHGDVESGSILYVRERCKSFGAICIATITIKRVGPPYLLVINYKDGTVYSLRSRRLLKIEGVNRKGIVIYYVDIE